MSDKTLVEKMRETAKNAREERKLPVYPPDQLEKLADAIEREYIERRKALPLPLYEDDEPVQFGDATKLYGVTLNHIAEIDFYENGRIRIKGTSVTSTSNECISEFCCDAKDRLKRPSPDVLDADGVQIRVGDTVWEVGRHRPLKVTAVEPGIVSYETEDGAHGMYYAIGDLTHKQPDSLERIDEDAKESVCVYFDKQGSTKCSGCDKSLHPYLECHQEMMLDLLNRQRKVLECNHER